MVRQLDGRAARSLAILFACLFVVMVGFGIALPVVPFFARRLDLAAGTPAEAVAVHLGLLTGLFALMQFSMAPLWGRWTDRIGRKRMLLLGIAGSAAAQALFGLSTSFVLLYGARALGGLFAAATVPAASAYVTDLVAVDTRAPGLAWLRTSLGLGSISGLAIGGLTARTDLHLGGGSGHFLLDGFSVPFFVAAALMLLAFAVAARWLPDTVRGRPCGKTPRARSAPSWWEDGSLRLALLLATVAQFGLAVFEGTFALYAQKKLGYGPAQVGTAFVVCGVVMTGFQYIAVRGLSRFLGARRQIAAGLCVMGAGILSLLLMRTTPWLLSAVGLFALGMAFVGPNVAALMAVGSVERVGERFGVQSAAESIGQVAGPLAGGILFAWYAGLPYLTAGIILLGAGLLAIGRKRPAVQGGK